MTTSSNNDNAFNKVAETIPFPDLARVSEMNGTMMNEIAKFNAQVSTNMQTVGKEWSEFVGMRLREDAQLFRSIHDCRSLQDLQQVYAQFWQTAFTQYGEEAQRMMKLTQGTVEDVTRNARELRDTVIHTDRAA
ncbi:MAG: phasin family protein [Candidatus Afipia apatlaquensis]|uniref:Phasin family protein n=1 Tax=Candidatus Afipia apatlaquensis TaxID=2712852 RepID=A0A7C9VK29_9BRAD|nr:phasin family protein [Candidatus Afipia apatlaquensis]